MKKMYALRSASKARDAHFRSFGGRLAAFGSASGALTLPPFLTLPPLRRLVLASKRGGVPPQMTLSLLRRLHLSTPVTLTPLRRRGFGCARTGGGPPPPGEGCITPCFHTGVVQL